MSTLHTNDITKWYDSLDDIKADGYSPVKVNSLVQFYKLDGRKSVINKQNLVPITYIEYVYFSPAENIFYLKSFPNYSVESLFLYKKLTKNDDNAALDQLRERFNSGFGMYLLFRKEQITDISTMLQRIWKANRSEEGKLSYKDYITLAELYLKLEDFKEYGKELTGFKTTCKIMEDKITDIWKNAKSNTK
jgi:hypothetical protein